jgi:molybdenum cofactor biosynthesis enzyme MoaA
MAGIEAAERVGLKIKLNAVALKGVNEDEYDDPTPSEKPRKLTSDSPSME